MGSRCNLAVADAPPECAASGGRTAQRGLFASLGAPFAADETLAVHDGRVEPRWRPAAAAPASLNGSAALAYLWLGVNITTTVQLGTPAVHVSGGVATAATGGAKLAGKS